MLRAPLGAFEAGEKVREQSFGLLRSLPLFATLPVATVETLAVRSQVGRFSAGTDIITQDDEAEAFYAIEQGTVEVFVDGVLRRTESAGEYFGEIALLRGGPRTATVRAASPVSVVALTRDDFLEGIGSHARSTHAAEVVVLERLAPAEA